MGVQGGLNLICEPNIDKTDIDICRNRFRFCLLSKTFDTSVLALPLIISWL